MNGLRNDWNAHEWTRHSLGKTSLLDFSETKSSPRILSEIAPCVYRSQQTTIKNPRGRHHIPLTFIKQNSNSRNVASVLRLLRRRCSSYVDVTSLMLALHLFCCHGNAILSVVLRTKRLVGWRRVVATWETVFFGSTVASDWLLCLTYQGSCLLPRSH